MQAAASAAALVKHYVADVAVPASAAAICAAHPALKLVAVPAATLATVSTMFVRRQGLSPVVGRSVRQGSCVVVVLVALAAKCVVPEVSVVSLGSLAAAAPLEAGLEEEYTMVGTLVSGAGGSIT